MAIPRHRVGGRGCRTNGDIPESRRRKVLTEWGCGTYGAPQDLRVKHVSQRRINRMRLRRSAKIWADGCFEAWGLESEVDGKRFSRRPSGQDDKRG
jgi:hypothetical protein